MIMSLDRILATLNSAEVGSLERLAEKMRSVASDLRALEHPELGAKADEAGKFHITDQSPRLRGGFNHHLIVGGGIGDSQHI